MVYIFSILAVNAFDFDVPDRKRLFQNYLGKALLNWQRFRTCVLGAVVGPKNYGDEIGMELGKRRMAKYKLPWRTNTEVIEEMSQTLKRKRNHVASMR
ncbi:hypothetical protein BC332_11965 [Capsicum chinense]|nr:hypothetical protein BC332_11965 [Capsicum chinense]